MALSLDKGVDGRKPVDNAKSGKKTRAIFAILLACFLAGLWLFLTTGRGDSDAIKFSNFDGEHKEGERATITLRGVEFAFRYCPKGKALKSGGGFLSSLEYETLDGYWLMETELTRAQLDAITGGESKRSSGNRMPANNLSYDDCKKLVAKLNEELAVCPEGWRFAIPSKYQWARACLVGWTPSTFSEPPINASILDGEDALNSIAWTELNSEGKPRRVALKRPNEWGFYDMIGNVAEICEEVDDDGNEGVVLRGGGYTDLAFDSGESLSNDERVPYGGARLALVENWEVGREVANFDAGELGGDRATLTINGKEFAFRYCPPGEFEMGAPGDSDNPSRKVSLTQGFWLMETELTEAQQEAATGERGYRDRRLPANDLSWNDADELAIKLNDVLKGAPDGWRFELPTEAQWEYACRAGQTEATPDKSRERSFEREDIRRVGKSKPNAWGFCDMSGNADEWVRDFYAKPSEGAATDPANLWASKGLERVVRSTKTGRSSGEPEDGRCGARFALVRGEGDVVDFDQGKNGGERATIAINGVSFSFRYCPPGEFRMGSPLDEEGRSGEEPQRKVSLSKGFWLMETEMTRAHWDALSGGNSSRIRGSRLPVNEISWNDCDKLITKLNRDLGAAPEGWLFSLPTEAQWEYACRAGSTEARYGELREIAWTEDDRDKLFLFQDSFPVGLKKPNAWGFYDMIGNVEEWCSDLYNADYYRTGEGTDPMGPKEGKTRVVRGGCLYSKASQYRSAARGGDYPEDRARYMGVRLALVPASVKVALFNPNATEAGERGVMTINGAEFTFRYCPPGWFEMGSPEGEGSEVERPMRKIALTDGFWLMENELTQAQWKALTGEDPSEFKGADLPVEHISWNECDKLVKTLNEEMKAAPKGWRFRLPSEAQWEYACRAGTSGSYWWGDSLNGDKANCDGGKPFGSQDKGAFVEKTTPAGSYDPNPWGFRDMNGNAWEWCADGYGEYDNWLSARYNPGGYGGVQERAQRGGAWNSSADQCRSAYRRGIVADSKDGFDGARLAFVPLAPAKPRPDVWKTRDGFTVEAFDPDASKAGERRVMKFNGVEVAFRYCPPGEFTGKTYDDNDPQTEQSQREVSISQGFWLMETELTQEQWKVVTGFDPSRFSGENLPVERIYEKDCENFVKSLNEKLLENQESARDGWRFALPTEDQWEYACRAGTTGERYGELDGIAWFADNSPVSTSPVGQKKPNDWGFYDMLGNVCELVKSVEENKTDSESTESESAAKSKSKRKYHWRGGCWVSVADEPSASARFDTASFISGTRLAFVPGPESPAKRNVDGFDQGEKGGDRAVLEIAGIEVAFRYCPPGSFIMGATNEESALGSNSERPLHEVSISKGFWTMETETTQKLWEAVVGENPSSFKGEQLPVERVSWNDCVAFVKKLNEELNASPNGWKFALPTEAQGEYACRAGTGESPKGDAWNRFNSGQTTRKVGQNEPNAWGLCDTLGNVEEWCQDFFGEYPFRGRIVDPVRDDAGDKTGMGKRGFEWIEKGTGTARVKRGGAWDDYANSLRAGYRGARDPDSRSEDQGVRLVLVSTVETAASSPGANAEVVKLDLVASKAGERRVMTINGVEFAFRYCPPGTFTMGSFEDLGHPIPQFKLFGNWDFIRHKVGLTKGFWLMETELTQAQWKAIVGNDPSQFKGEDRPVDHISWNDCDKFLWSLNEEFKAAPDGWKFSLPTEAQWEYAARAGTIERRYGNLNDVAWHKGNSDGETKPVGQKTPNPWGFVDMIGNVAEWCSDLCDVNYGQYENVVDPIGLEKGTFCVRRGGAADSEPLYSQAASRRLGSAIYVQNFSGARIALVSTEPGEGAPVNFDDPKIEDLEVSKFQPEKGKTGERRVMTIGGVEFAFRYCPQGEFELGVREGEKNRDKRPARKARFSRGFWLMETELTQAQWKIVKNENPSEYVGDNLPVECVSWDDCSEYAEKLNNELGAAPEGWKLQLPTEAQWELAARAGTNSERYGDLDEIAWYRDNGGGTTRPVGQKKPNAWGFYDTIGNVDEWCLDWLRDWIGSEGIDPIGPLDRALKSLRGGSFEDEPDLCSLTSWKEELCDRSHRSYSRGFRLALVSTREPEESNDAKNEADSTPKKPSQSEKAPAKSTSQKAGDRHVLKINGVEFAFRYCPPGEFMMGSPEKEEGRSDKETPRHKVILTKGYWLMETELTQKQWKALTSEKSSRFKGDDLPVEWINWDDCQELIKKLNDHSSKPSGWQFNLPTEAQWEYACRAGAETPFFWGSSLNGDKANCNGNNPYGTTTKGKYLKKTSPTGSYAPNAWGFYDMHGNVWEWCQDWYGNYPEGEAIDPVGADAGSRRVVRGGGWFLNAVHCRSATRGWFKPDERRDFLGVRLALIPTGDAEIPIPETR